MLNTQELQQSDSTHYLHPFTDAKSLKKKGARVITRAEGIYLWDSDGNRLLDGMAGLWCVNVGYGRKILAQTAMRQLEELPYYNTFFQTTHPPAVALSEKLANLAPPGFNRVFLVNSGSEANDTVLRMIRRYWDFDAPPIHSCSCAKPTVKSVLGPLYFSAAKFCSFNQFVLTLNFSL